jgi:hypothetical protein
MLDNLGFIVVVLGRRISLLVTDKPTEKRDSVPADAPSGEQSAQLRLLVLTEGGDRRRRHMQSYGYPRLPEETCYYETRVKGMIGGSLLVLALFTIFAILGEPIVHTVFSQSTWLT